MKQLYFYDTEGNIYFNTPYVENYNTLGVEVPEGKRLISIDITQDPPVPILEDLPVDETQERLTALEMAVADMLGGM